MRKKLRGEDEGLEGLRGFLLRTREKNEIVFVTSGKNPQNPRNSPWSFFIHQVCTTLTRGNARVARSHEVVSCTTQISASPD